MRRRRLGVEHEFYNGRWQYVGSYHSSMVDSLIQSLRQRSADAPPVQVDLAGNHLHPEDARRLHAALSSVHVEAELEADGTAGEDEDSSASRPTTPPPAVLEPGSPADAAEEAARTREEAEEAARQKAEAEAKTETELKAEAQRAAEARFAAETHAKAKADEEARAARKKQHILGRNAQREEAHTYLEEEVGALAFRQKSLITSA